jgi:hypothetical protein
MAFSFVNMAQYWKKIISIKELGVLLKLIRIPFKLTRVPLGRGFRKCRIE